MTGGKWFSPIPGHSTKDERLSVSHWRVLAVVAGADRFGKNGAGCYMSRNSMAIASSCHPATVSACLRDLVDWGYLNSQVFPLDKRRNAYRVRYQEVPASKNNVADRRPISESMSSPESLSTLESNEDSGGNILGEALYKKYGETGADAPEKPSPKIDLAEAVNRSGEAFHLQGGDVGVARRLWADIREQGEGVVAFAIRHPDIFQEAERVETDSPGSGVRVLVDAVMREVA